MALRIEIMRTARRGLLALPAAKQRAIASKITALAENPTPDGCIKLKTRGDFRRIRVGDYRIVYNIDPLQQLVTVVAIAHRRDVYRGF